MSLDFHAAKTEQEATYKTREAFFDEKTHGYLFRRVPENKYPLFNKIKNYYKDVKYSVEELGTLLLELKDLIQNIKEDKMLVDHLNSVYCMCEKAMENKDNIWVYCD